MVFRDNFKRFIEEKTGMKTITPMKYRQRISV